MHNEGDAVHLSEEEASGGSKDGIVRWVLVLGLLLAIGAMTVIWITGALSSTDPNADNANVSAKIAAEKERAAGNADVQSLPPPDAAASSSEREVSNGDPVVKN